MDKNSLILEIKNDLNSIKKQVEVTLAKLTVLESMIELDNKLGISVAEPVEAPVEELGVEEPKLEPVVEAPVVEPEPVVEPIAEPEPEPIAVPESVVETETSPIIESESVIEDDSEQEIVEIEQVIELEIEDKVEEEESTPNSQLLTPNCEAQALRNLMSVIGLNDRFRFRHDLFANSDELFRETIDILNKVENFESAVDYLMQKFNWDEEDATVVYFYDIIKPKF